MLTENKRPFELRRLQTEGDLQAMLVLVTDSILVGYEGPLLNKYFWVEVSRTSRWRETDEALIYIKNMVAFIRRRFGKKHVGVFSISRTLTVIWEFKLTMMRYGIHCQGSPQSLRMFHAKERAVPVIKLIVQGCFHLE
ncbi:MAG: hypothetical protein IPJ50_20405 [Betaproteobacteria bacterium]|nr:hypothetical protein [Betaproteobacteria bacterium]